MIEPPQVSVSIIAEENTIMFVIEAFQFDEVCMVDHNVVL